MNNLKIMASTAACLSEVALTACGGSDKNKADSDDTANESLTVMIGSYSESGDSALRVYSYDPTSGSLVYQSSLPVANASYFTQSPSGMIYVVTESDADASSISAIRPISDTGAFQVVNTQPVGSGAPCYVAVSPDGKFAVTANYTGGTAAVFPIADDGSLMPRSQLLSFTGSGPVAERQNMPHPHCIAFTPDGKYMLIEDLGTDKIHQFALLYGADNLVADTPTTDVQIAPGSGPRHIVFNKKGDIAYLINELADNITVLQYDGASLTPVQYIAADTMGAGGAADIHLSANGKHLYASLRLKNDGLATFDVDPDTGLLTYRAHTPTLAHPRNFTLTPDGAKMLVASRDGNAVQIFDIDHVTGIPSDTGDKLDLDMPVCVKFIDISPS